MPSDYLPGEDAQLSTWLATFLTGCEKYDAILDLDSEEITAITTKSTAYDNGLALADAKKAEARDAVAAKNADKADVSSYVRTLVRGFKANPAVPQNVLQALGVIATPAPTAVYTVTALTVNGCSDGVNKLKWNRTGNAPSTLFLIESRMSTSGPWVLVGAVSKTSFDHSNQIPGETQYYRVTSTRSGQASAPCAPIVVYGATGGNTLKVAA